MPQSPRSPQSVASAEEAMAPPKAVPQAAAFLTGTADGAGGGPGNVMCGHILGRGDSLSTRGVAICIVAAQVAALGMSSHNAFAMGI